MTDLVLDHVLYGVTDLDEAHTEFMDRYGLASIAGGRHPGHGTANRIIPLGPNYIELIAVVDPDEAAESPLGRRIASADRGWVGYANRTDSIETHLEGGQAVAMSRIRPDGVELRWRIAHFGRFASGEGPILIQWDIPPELLPGRSPAPHRVAPTGISEIVWSKSTLASVIVGMSSGDQIEI